MQQNQRQLQRLMEKVYQERGFDFRDYKESTLIRRLERRLNSWGVKSYAEYASVLDRYPDEYDKLFNDLTITVTSFFRDEVAFRALEEIALPAVIKRTVKKKRGLRIWSAGCATGEEPYSIAMLLLELLGKKLNLNSLTLLATDIDTKALQQAKEGIFPKEEIGAIRSALRRKYFSPLGGSYRIKATLRRLVTFKEHNLVNDAPYEKLDLIVCRNVLIYFSSSLQMKVLRDFYDGLKRGGFLLLGKAEVPMGEGVSLFEYVDKKAKLFKKVIYRESRKEEPEVPKRRIWHNVRW